MSALIEAGAPKTWQDLERGVGAILTECGYDVELQKHVQLARGDVDVDVWADDHAEPPNVLAIECKHWASAVTKSVVHAFRTVVGDSGANTGLLIASSGFQAGAIDAARYSNVRLLSWSQFQELFTRRWFIAYMARTIDIETDALHEYTEPINSRIFRKADSLPPSRRAEFKRLREKHAALAMTNFSFHPVMIELNARRSNLTALPELPLSKVGLPISVTATLPAAILEATALRPLLTGLVKSSQDAIREFDDIFGERA